MPNARAKYKICPSITNGSMEKPNQSSSDDPVSQLDFKVRRYSSKPVVLSLGDKIRLGTTGFDHRSTNTPLRIFDFTACETVVYVGASVLSF